MPPLAPDVTGAERPAIGIPTYALSTSITPKAQCKDSLLSPCNVYKQDSSQTKWEPLGISTAQENSCVVLQ